MQPGGTHIRVKAKLPARCGREPEETDHPPRVKITLTVVSTSTGSLLSR